MFSGTVTNCFPDNCILFTWHCTHPVLWLGYRTRGCISCVEVAGCISCVEVTGSAVVPSAAIVPELYTLFTVGCILVPCVFLCGVEES